MVLKRYYSGCIQIVLSDPCCSGIFNLGARCREEPDYSNVDDFLQWPADVFSY